MVRNNFILQEAIDNKFNPGPVVAEIKKVMNTCKLTKFKSAAECAKVYSALFACQVELEMTFDQWCLVYTNLLNDDSFCKSLCAYIMMYQPAEYAGMFQPLVNLIDSELREMHANRVRYLSDAKAFFSFLQMRYDSIGTTVKAQTNDPAVIKFLTTINGVLATDIFYLNKLVQNEVDAQSSPDDISYVVHTPLTEEAEEILNYLQNYDQWVMENFGADLDEAIVSDAKSAAKALYVKQEKASKAFDEFIMKKVKEYRTKRQNRKHAEMVGEALRINHELKRLLGSLALGVLNPAWGVIAWVCSVVIDRYTDKKDRDLLVGQLKDELEIVEEKISQAERNGDDKAKVELIRFRQKLQRELERINHYRFDSSKPRPGV